MKRTFAITASTTTALAVLATLIQAPAISQEALMTNWDVSVDSDPFTERVTAGANLVNPNGDVLSFACNGIGESILSVQYRPKKYLGSTNNLVLIKLGDAEPIPGILWEYTSKGAYTISEPFIEAFSKLTSGDAQRILVRAYNYEDQPVDATFSSFGARGAVNEIRQACGVTKI